LVEQTFLRRDVTHGRNLGKVLEGAFGLMAESPTTVHNEGRHYAIRSARQGVGQRGDVTLRHIGPDDDTLCDMFLEPRNAGRRARHRGNVDVLVREKVDQRIPRGTGATDEQKLLHGALEELLQAID